MTTTVEKHNFITVASRPCRNGVSGYVAFGKAGDFECNPASDDFAITEPGELHFEFGGTSAIAVTRLLADMGVTCQNT